MNLLLKAGQRIEAFKSYLSWSRSTEATGGEQRTFYSLTDIANIFGGSGSKMTDANAINNGYSKNNSWYSIVTKVARGVASLPITLYTIDGEEKTKVDQGELYDLIFNPNQNQSFRELSEEQMIYLSNNGEAYYYLDRGGSFGGKVKRIISLPPEVMTVLKSSKSILSEVTGYEMRDGSSNHKFLPEEILHIVYPNPTLIGKRTNNGLSPLEAGNYKINASNNNAIAQAAYFANRGVSNLVSSDGGSSGLSMTPQDEEALARADKVKFGGAEKMGSIVTIPTPVKVHQLGSSSSDMEMLGHDKQYLRDLCNLLFMPSELFNDPDNKTHANRKEAVKTAYNDVFIPNCQLLLDGYMRTIISFYSKAHGSNYSLQIDYDKIDALKPDPLALRELLIKEVDSGIKTPNEARLLAGDELHPDELMDVPRIRNNYVSITEVDGPKE